MTDVPGFAKEYRRPDLDAVQAEVRVLRERCAAATTPEQTLELVREWNRLRKTLDTQWNIALVRYEQDTTDADAKAEREFWDDAAPVLRELDVTWARALVDSPHHDAIAVEYGDQLLALKQCTAATFAPEIRDALAQEARLVSRYQELMARTECEVRGETLSLSALQRYFSDGDRDVRLDAQRSRDAFLASHGDQLDDMFDQLVRLRDGMGRALGHADFIPLGYQLMTRVGYGPDEVAVFRDALRAEIVPLADELHGRQARRLGLDRVLFHDEPVWDPQGNAHPTGGVDEIVAGARTMYGELHPEIGEFFELMVDRELLDLELRDGKAGGGFCTVFADQGVPFVFANFNGSEHDVQVITHECGHAFQAYSARELPLLEFSFPTYEAAEVHSMAMEYLTYPWMHLFFGDDAERYKRIHLEQNIAALPYLVAVDHFQHEIYANPGLAPAERRALWLDMERRYLPHRDYGGLLPYMQTGAFWQRQRHIYGMPFYYVDYALAQVCAMQLWIRAESDRDAALADYLEICRVGGSLSFTDMIEVGRLRSPFDPDVLRDVAAHARAALGL